MVSVRYLTYSMFHNKDPVVGSTFIRVNQLLKYWPQAGLYKYGEQCDAMIFQKVYMAYDYQFPKNYKGVKILDICDPDWLEGLDVADTARAMDAITCPTEALAEFMRQLTPSPVYVVPDRWDVDPKVLGAPKQHRQRAKTVLWFGYSHNADALKPALRTLNELGLNLIIVSNDDPLLHRFDVRDPKEYYTFKRYSEDTIIKYLKLADFAILPGDYRPQGKFKSNNKTTKAILAGLPVATNGDEVRLYMDAEARQAYMHKNYATIKEQYDVRKSVSQMQQIIKDVKNGN